LQTDLAQEIDKTFQKETPSSTKCPNYVKKILSRIYHESDKEITLCPYKIMITTLLERKYLIQNHNAPLRFASKICIKLLNPETGNDVLSCLPDDLPDDLLADH
jgi:hypothetical protein